MTRRTPNGQLSLLLVIEGTAPPPVPITLTDAEIAEAFAAWYRTFPRHVAPKHALREYARILRDGEATIEQLLEGVRRYAEDCRRRGTEPRFICHPGTWLRAGRWADEYEPAPLSRTAASFGRVGAALGAARDHR